MIPIRYNLRSLMVRRATAAMTASVVALVVMLLFILSGFVAGLRATVMQNALPDNWIVLSRGTTDEGSSYISHEQYEIVKSRPQIATTADGQALISPEMITGFNANPSAPPSQSLFTMIRGVYPIAYQVHGGMRLDSWTMAGARHVRDGGRPQTRARFPNLAVGSDFKFGPRTFKIVGIFSDRDSARESEVLTDLGILTQDVHFANGFAVLHVVLKPGTHEDFRKIADDRFAGQARRDVGAGVLREADRLHRSVARARPDRRADSRDRLRYSAR